MILAPFVINNDTYIATVKRSDLVNEIKLILNKQKELNSKINDEFIKKYLDIFESQRSFEEGPGGNSPYGGNQIEKMIGKCTFEKSEPRAVKASYTFEYFKLLQDINHIRLEYKAYDGGKNKSVSVPLNSEQRDKIIQLAKKIDSISFDKIRKILNLDYDVRFNIVRYDLKKATEKEDIINLSEKESKLKEYQSYHKIRKVLDKVKKGAIEEIPVNELDCIAYALSVYKNDDSKRKYLQKNCNSLSCDMIEKLLEHKK